MVVKGQWVALEVKCCIWDTVGAQLRRGTRGAQVYKRGMSGALMYTKGTKHFSF